MLEMLEKLINEHGSSVILKERLQLFSDKYEVLQERNAHLTQKNEDLERDLVKAKKEIAELRQTILDSEKAVSVELSEREAQILKILFDTNEDY